MKRILATTAMTLMLTTASYAVEPATGFQTYEIQTSNDIYASDFIGMRIYSAANQYDMFEPNSMVEPGAEQEWEDIGEINDIVLDRDGNVQAVILGVGGFLGVGEKDVAVDMDSIKMVNQSGTDGDFFLVVNADKEMLSEAPTFDRMIDEGTAMVTKAGTKVKEYVSGVATSAETAMTDAKENVSTMATDAKDQVSTMATDAKENMSVAANEAERTMLMAPNVVRDGWDSAVADELTTEDLTGARVYGVNDEDIGEVDKLLVTDNGKIDKAILDIGGFLGVGEHRIAVSMDELSILREEQGAGVKIYIEATMEQLKNQPEYVAS